jgi:type II secretory ATPase GspE/PulE/Tfp pilus assembly ATPase PilB-like protein
MLTLQQIGMSPKELNTLLDLAYANHGIILVTGPPKSGKTTTLLAIQEDLRHPDSPQFPRDIILVDEIDSQETALNAIQAALDGSLVLCSIQSTDPTASAVSQLVEMGIEPLLVASTLRAIMRQDLLRMICIHCREVHRPTEAELAVFGEVLEVVFSDAPGQVTDLIFFKGKGCEKCAGTGYAGQIAVFEFMALSRGIRDLILEPGWSTTTLHAKALAEGMTTMALDAFVKAGLGVITLEEAARFQQPLA